MRNLNFRRFRGIRSVFNRCRPLLRPRGSDQFVPPYRPVETVVNNTAIQHVRAKLPANLFQHIRLKDFLYRCDQAGHGCWIANAQLTFDLLCYDPLTSQLCHL